MLVERKLNAPADMNHNQDNQPDNVGVLQKKLAEESGKLKALEQYANSLRLLRAKQTEQHARLEDKVRQLEKAYAAVHEASQHQLRIDALATNDCETKLIELQEDYTKIQQELKEKILKIKALSIHPAEGQVTELNEQVQMLETENNTLKEDLAELQIVRKQLSEINTVTTQAEYEKQTALEQVSSLSAQVEALKQMAQECSDLVDVEQNAQAQAANKELNEIQAELDKIRTQANDDIKAMREQMQQSTEDTARLIAEMEQEKQRITELEFMAHPLSLANDERRPEAVFSQKERRAEQLGKISVDDSPHHLAANGPITTILISIVCAGVLAMLLLFTTEGGRQLLTTYLNPQEQTPSMDGSLSLLDTESQLFS